MLMKSPLVFENDPRISARKLGSKNLRPKISGPDDVDWADRSEFWLHKIAPKSRQFTKRAGISQPLILSGHGVSLRIDHGRLMVRNGFTHYPQDREEWLFFPGDWRLPSRIVVLDVDGSLTFGALSWLANHNLPLVHINWRGKVLNIVGTGAGALDSKLVKLQRAAHTNGRGLRIAQHLIQAKIANSIDTLRLALPKSATVDSAIAKLEADHKLVKRIAPLNTGRLRGIEGRVGYAYFSAWRTCPLRWKGIDRHPIPDEWHRIGPRSSKASEKRRPNRNATHPVNAILNYAYAILESRVRQHVAAAGLDPSIGFLHGSYDDKLPLIYDLMEPLRPVVDRKVLEFVQGQTFAAGDFTLLQNGICRLNPQLGRNVVREIDVSEGVCGSVSRFISALHKTLAT